MRVAVLAGGLGGSRFALALAETIDSEELTIVGNVGDDVEVLGLHVSPDLDTILYTLTGRLDDDRGWGRKDETWNALALAAPHLFAPLYGPGSAERFLARAERLGVPATVAAIPNLVDDVDTLDDLERLEERLGRHTAAVLDALRTGLAR